MLFGPNTPVTQLSGAFADLTIRAAFDGLGPTAPTFASAIGGKFGNYPLDGFEGEITAERNCGALFRPSIAAVVLLAGPLRVPEERVALGSGGALVARVGTHAPRAARPGRAPDLRNGCETDPRSGWSRGHKRPLAGAP